MGVQIKACLLIAATRPFLIISRPASSKYLFSKRNTPVAHAAGFWDFHSLITAAAAYQPLGFGTTGGKLMGQKEVAAFLGHGGSKTSCENYKYGKTGEALEIYLLNHPEFIENNATLAFQAAIWKWMTPGRKHQPSAHDAFVGIWKPAKNDTLAKRVPGFGTTMDALYGDEVSGRGDDESMNNIVSHYLYYLDLMGVGGEEGGHREVLSCAEQVPFTQASASASSSELR